MNCSGAEGAGEIDCLKSAQPDDHRIRRTSDLDRAYGRGTEPIEGELLDDDPNGRGELRVTSASAPDGRRLRGAYEGRFFGGRFSRGKTIFPDAKWSGWTWGGHRSDRIATIAAIVFGLS